MNKKLWKFYILLQGFKSKQTKFQTQIVTNSNKIITYTTLELKHFCHLQNLVKKDILKEKDTYLKIGLKFWINLHISFNREETRKSKHLCTTRFKNWLNSNFIFLQNLWTIFYGLIGCYFHPIRSRGASLPYSSGRGMFALKARMPRIVPKSIN